MSVSKLNTPICVKFTENLGNLLSVIEMLLFLFKKRDITEKGITRHIIEYYIGIDITFAPHSVSSILRFIKTYEIDIDNCKYEMIRHHGMLNRCLTMLSITFTYNIEYNFVNLILCNTLAASYTRDNFTEINEFINSLRGAKNINIYKEFKRFINDLYTRKLVVVNINPSLYPYLQPINMLMI